MVHGSFRRTLFELRPAPLSNEFNCSEVDIALDGKPRLTRLLDNAQALQSFRHCQSEVRMAADDAVHARYDREKMETSGVI